MNSLITSDNQLAIWGVLFFAAALGFWGEKQSWGKSVSGAVVAMAVTFVLSNLSIIPIASDTYDVVWGIVVPLAIPLFLYQADLRKIFTQVGPMLIAFCFGVIGTVVGTWVATTILPLGDEAWKLAGVFSATYIGGSVNFASTAQAIELTSGDLLSAGTAADNLVMTLYFLLLFSMAGITALVSKFKVRKSIDDDSGREGIVQNQSSQINLLHFSIAIALTFTIFSISKAIALELGYGSATVLVITLITLVLATCFPHKIGKIEGAADIGMLLMYVFFGVIGASANIGAVLKVGPVLFLYAAIILVIHLLFSLLGGWLFKLDLREVLVASNANTGGPTTATAMAASRNWHGLVTPAILVGTLGYAIATFIGIAVAHFMK